MRRSFYSALYSFIQAFIHSLIHSFIVYSILLFIHSFTVKETGITKQRKWEKRFKGRIKGITFTPFTFQTGCGCSCEYVGLPLPPFIHNHFHFLALSVSSVHPSVRHARVVTLNLNTQKRVFRMLQLVLFVCKCVGRGLGVWLGWGNDIVTPRHLFWCLSSMGRPVSYFWKMAVL